MCRIKFRTNIYRCNYKTSLLCPSNTSVYIFKVLSCCRLLSIRRSHIRIRRSFNNIISSL
nr:MAG TPA: hypothetical protein [Bacteriophage sp.]